ncbi:MAG: nucleoside-diphosphate kinase [Thermoguttaceae bacterium]|nr:nucleoside-diphosphate kinase [Thermoguttaceae bacterium]MDW8077511.1 nucleoside-diphosphate kinase [Thermoguttaceae bacterium]
MASYPPDLEQTLVLIKPDALKLSLTGYILSQFSEFHTRLRFAGMKVVHVTRVLAETHYAEHRGKSYYPTLIDYIMGRIHYRDLPYRRRVIAIVYCGPNAVATIRNIAGPTNPHEARESKPGSIRALGTVVPIVNANGEIIGHRLDNLVHASDSPESAEREIKLWFKPNDIMPFMRIFPTTRCRRHFYIKDDTLYPDYLPDSFCLMAPGDTVWTSDLELLERIERGEEPKEKVWQVAAKYLINELTEMEE